VKNVFFTLKTAFFLANLKKIGHISIFGQENHKIDPKKWGFIAFFQRNVLILCNPHEKKDNNLLRAMQVTYN